jgi:hypothetical protein
MAKPREQAADPRRMGSAFEGVAIAVEHAVMTEAVAQIKAGGDLRLLVALQPSSLAGLLLHLECAAD